MTGTSGPTPLDVALAVASSSNAEVVVLKMGARGSLVYEGGSASIVPAYITERVWKIGSGDNFVAHFGYRWMTGHCSGHDAARQASLATAYYCNHRAFAKPNALTQFSPPEMRTSERFSSGWKPNVYLAGPFFTLGQLWLIEQARNDLRDGGLDVFSPYHDVGHGSRLCKNSLEIPASEVRRWCHCSFSRKLAEKENRKSPLRLGLPPSRPQRP